MDLYFRGFSVHYCCARGQQGEDDKTEEGPFHMNYHELILNDNTRKEIVTPTGIVKAFCK